MGKAERTGKEAKEKSEVNGEKDMVLKNVLRVQKSLIVGYLFNKVQEVEKVGIGVRYKVELDAQSPIPEYQLIETLEILFDHVVVKMLEIELPKRKIYFTLKQKNSKVTIKFANASYFLKLDDMAVIWEKSNIRNGKGQENGLYQLKKLVKDNGGNIYVCMKTVDDINYLCTKVILNASLG